MIVGWNFNSEIYPSQQNSIFTNLKVFMNNLDKIACMQRETNDTCIVP